MPYDYAPCDICGRTISKGGVARTSHMRAHVRRGEAKELKHKGRLVFVKTQNGEYEEPEPYAVLGEKPADHQPDGVFDITEALNNLPAIDPKQYFITSGEAVRKADKLVSDFYSAAVRAKVFRTKLEEARASAKHLETQHDDGRLLAKRKSPRRRKNG